MQAENIINWLASPEGIRLANLASAMPDDSLLQLTQLRQRTSIDRANAILDQLNLRRRARYRFPSADSMYFTASGLNQATVPAIARYHGSLLRDCQLVLDAGCGIGADLREIAAFCPVIAVDTSVDTLACARLNTRGYAAHGVRFVCADVTTLSMEALTRGGVDGLFCDPGRRQEAAGITHRVRSAELSSPPLSWLLSAVERFPQILFKLSPAIPDDELRQLGGSVQFVSFGGQCREALSLPKRSLTDYTAVRVADDGSSEELTVIHGSHVGAGQTGEWLYEPDPAAIRAHLVDTLAVLSQTHRLVDGLAYLTGDALVKNSWLTPYRVIEPVPCDVRYLRAWQKRSDRRISVVKTRGATPTPEEMIAKLRDPAVNGAKQAVLFLARDRTGVTAVLCEPAS